MQHMIGALGAIAARVGVFGVLVFFHELGHYLAARWRGIHVEAFSIGFGRALLSWTDKHGTDWKLSIIPLGGYVRMHGMAVSVLEEDAVDQSAIRHGEAYFEKSVASRSIVTAAGPIANFLLAVVLYIGLFAIIGQQVFLPDPIAGRVVAGGAADQAGLQKGDRFIAIDGKPVASFSAMRDIIVADGGRTVPVAVQRGGRNLVLSVRVENDNGVGRIGVESSSRTERLSPPQAVLAGLEQTWDILSGTIIGLWHMVGSGQGLSDVGGPIRIIQLTGEVAQQGFGALVALTAALSVSLGLFNLFPIPILDGGHLMFYAIEALRGRPLLPRTQDYGYRVGFAIIASLFLVISLHDLVRVGAFRWFSHVVG
jgi:regulator of sigma E protease